MNVIIHSLYMRFIIGYLEAYHRVKQENKKSAHHCDACCHRTCVDFNRYRTIIEHVNETKKQVRLFTVLTCF